MFLSADQIFPTVTMQRMPSRPRWAALALLPSGSTEGHSAVFSLTQFLPFMQAWRSDWSSARLTPPPPIMACPAAAAAAVAPSLPSGWRRWLQGGYVVAPLIGGVY